MGTMSIMGREGDVKVEWNANNRDEVELARKMFEENKKKGFKPFRLTLGNSKGKELIEFDQYAERILFVPPMQGG